MREIEQLSELYSQFEAAVDPITKAEAAIMLYRAASALLSALQAEAKDTLADVMDRLGVSALETLAGKAIWVEQTRTTIDTRRALEDRDVRALLEAHGLVQTKVRRYLRIS